MKFEFIDTNKYRYELKFYHRSYSDYYLLYTIYMEPPSSISSAFKIVNKKIEWPKSDSFFSFEAKEFCNKTIERINKNLVFS